MQTILRLLVYALLLWTCSKQNAFAQLYCNNLTEKPIWITIAYTHIPIETGEGMWVTEGWLLVKPNETIQLSSNMGYHKTYGSKVNFFYYAYQENGREWKGDRKLLMETTLERNPQRLDFRIEKAHDHTLHEMNLEHLLYGLFKAAAFAQGKTYTIELHQNDENPALAPLPSTVNQEGE